MENCHVFYSHWFLKITMWFNSNHPSMAHLVACDYFKCSCKCSHRFGVPRYTKSLMAMDEKLWPSCKVCHYTFNFMAMSCLL